MCQDQQQTRSNPSGNLCQHDAYADLCITCHPDDCEIVQAATELTKTLNIAAVDRQARPINQKRERELCYATYGGHLDVPHYHR